MLYYFLQDVAQVVLAAGCMQQTRACTARSWGVNWLQIFRDHLQFNRWCSTPSMHSQRKLRAVQRINVVSVCCLHRQGYDKYGYDKEGFNKDGINFGGYDKSGFNTDGFNK